MDLERVRGALWTWSSVVTAARRAGVQTPVLLIVLLIAQAWTSTQPALAEPGSRPWNRVGSLASELGPLLPEGEFATAHPAGGVRSVAISGNGKFALVGEPDWQEGAVHGQVLAFARKGATWSLEGPPLTGEEEEGSSPYGSRFGSSVALSRNGQTAIVGGENDGDGRGAIWVFTRSANGDWAKEGQKIVAPTAEATEEFGASVALSANGRIALVGAPDQGLYEERLGSGEGGLWIFARSGASWVAQVPKLGATGDPRDLDEAHLGVAVAISGNGKTVLGTESPGLDQVYAKARAGWTPQGEPLKTRPDAEFDFGNSVALSNNGDTALLGGNSAGVAGAWIFNRSGSRWSPTQQLAFANTASWDSVGLSGDGTTALVAGSIEHPTGEGERSETSAWVFRLTGSTWSEREQLTVADSGGSNAGAISTKGDYAMLGGYDFGGSGKIAFFGPGH